MVKAVTDLPEPGLADDADDFSPRLTASDTSSIACGRSPRAGRRTVRSRIREPDRLGRHPRFAILGSSVSRRPSPSMFTASTVSARKTPGNRMPCG